MSLALDPSSLRHTTHTARLGNGSRWIEGEGIKIRYASRELRKMFSLGSTRSAQNAQVNHPMLSQWTTDCSLLLIELACPLQVWGPAMDQHPIAGHSPGPSLRTLRHQQHPTCSQTSPYPVPSATSVSTPYPVMNTSRK